MENHTSSVLPIAVFVHLGPKLPKHLLLNLERHSNLFPHIETVLIIDHPHLETLPQSIQRYLFIESIEDKNLFTHMEEYSDFKFRNGFWKYTFLRLFAIGDFHKYSGDKPLLHIESDVILMPDFPWEKFQEISTVAWMRVNEDNDVAALVYSPNALETRFFIDSIRNYAFDDPKTTDMFSMIRYARENSSRHTYLPSITGARSRHASTIGDQQKSMVQHFGGYFDPLALGLWHFGQDPKNTHGITRRYVDQTHHDYFAPSAKLKFEKNRLTDASGVDVFALHVHSKDLRMFSPKWESALVEILLDAEEGRNERSFALHSFMDSLRDRSLRAHLWIIIARIPGISYLGKLSYLKRIKNYLKKLFRIEF